MSDNWIRIIPEVPDFVPDAQRQERAVSYLRSIAPAADDVAASMTDHLAFIDCGGNFESVACPSCRSALDLKQWRAWMDEDFDGKGFTLTPRAMVCCAARHTLHELKYEFPQGFARFELAAMNPNVGQLSMEQRSRFEVILNCPVRVIYQHL